MHQGSARLEVQCLCDYEQLQRLHIRALLEALITDIAEHGFDVDQDLLAIFHRNHILSQIQSFKVDLHCSKTEATIIGKKNVRLDV